MSIVSRGHVSVESVSMEVRGNNVQMMHNINMYRTPSIMIGSNDIRNVPFSPSYSNLMADLEGEDINATKKIGRSKVGNQGSFSSKIHSIDCQESVKAPNVRSPFHAITRKKSAPRHRCSAFNRSVSSILKASQYSPAESDARLSRSLPPNSIIQLTGNVLDDIVVDEARLRKSMPDLSSGSTWSPKGVDFALTVEVCFFRP
ncbi:hypothetical protein HJC23_004678 [Cyclotella cryptica]|uniref:Uncharacterized protein n=1 Tax=Cyclotella cryptica TaxID=29204 RepID=A0ABD3PLJ9_9STRA